jgi:hypothetical protein
LISDKEEAMTQCPPIDPTQIQKNLETDFDAWFTRLQALTPEVLVAEDWTERWFDGYTPEDALQDGSEDAE